MTQPNPLKIKILDSLPTQPNPTHGSTQPMDNSALCDVTLRRGTGEGMDCCWMCDVGRSGWELTLLSLHGGRSET